MKKCIINQPFGIGDILFSEPIAQYYIDKGYEVIWPVEDSYFWIKDYMPWIHFVPRTSYKIDYEISKFTTINGAEYIPLRFANPIFRGLEPHDYSDLKNCMVDKYRLLGLPEDLWRKLKWIRNKEKEDSLFNKLNLEGKRYNLRNINFGASGSKINIIIGNDLENVDMTFIEGYSMLDWAKVIEEAENIYTVSTSNLYMIETLNIKAKELHLYPRVPVEKDLVAVESFISKKWKLHGIN